MADKVIHVHKNGTVEPDSCPISHNQKQGVVWITDNDVDDDVHIDFTPKTPFASSSFVVPGKGGQKSSGALVQGEIGDHFYYTSRRQSQSDAADPEIVIQP